MTEILRKLSGEERDALIAEILSELSGGAKREIVSGLRSDVPEELESETWSDVQENLEYGLRRGIPENSPPVLRRDTPEGLKAEVKRDTREGSESDTWRDSTKDLTSVIWSVTAEDTASGDTEARQLKKQASALLAKMTLARAEPGEVPRIRREKGERLLETLYADARAYDSAEAGRPELQRAELHRAETEGDKPRAREESGERQSGKAENRVLSGSGAAERGVFPIGTVNEDVPRGALMAEVSDFFRRDSRRYDNGFELH